ncbi:MAG: DUF697 domain-containing protein [Microcystis sp. M54BS1]|jgi:uncharacterized protein (DUF697 family)|uniref:slr1306 family protein n=1 Tax=unclassified Microcystis TaxID=2643300 RepID=UPI001DA69048|nr:MULTISPECIES: DUF697 domain-containing protein [unclassified Microcystis]MBE5230524.1 DUF697 domain-containing protein [Microcystis aeruginosa PMC 728.11]MCA2541053.1 DUF697 domain-containing protein [Microcystis sp. M54BS1]MCA2598064.1 DUF697 domain-containing protein [Microcystis sp. M38BS1]MCA2612651.1 DUF697 domain-containing protein [Microcystis sp. M27BS1]MCA2507155.1 DUF697 domain-containing protein [Microcystis sp. M62BS1]
MTGRLGKPILVTGIGITIAFTLGETLNSRLSEIGSWGIFGAIALGAGIWFWQKPNTKIDFSPPTPLSLEKVKQAISKAEKIINYLANEDPNQDLTPLKTSLTQLNEEFSRQDLKIAITGARKTGKTALKKLLESGNFGESIAFLETEPLLTFDSTANQKKALAADLVLYLINGDLSDSEWQILQQFDRMHQRVILLLNKQDRLPAETREEILLSLKQRLKETIPAHHILAIAAAPEPLKVRQHQSNGEIKEWTEPQTVVITPLDNHLRQIIEQEKSELVLGTIWRQALELAKETKQLLNQSRRKKALPVIEQYQWIAATATFANPLAALDLVLAAATNAQMLVDLGAIYQQKMSLEQAKTAMTTLGKMMVQLGMVEVTTQALGTILKGNAITYIAGGTVQGIGAAYLTRLAGLSLVEYFQEQEINEQLNNDWNWTSLQNKVKQVWEQNQRLAFLQDFVKQMSARWSAFSG